jgi:hypothetical protein
MKRRDRPLHPPHQGIEPELEARLLGQWHGHGDDVREPVCRQRRDVLGA